MQRSSFSIKLSFVSYSQAESCIFATVLPTLLPFFYLFWRDTRGMFFIFICRFAGLRKKPITSVQFKFVAAWSFSGSTSSKTKICCRKKNSSLLCASILPQLATLYFVARQVGYKHGNTGNNVFQQWSETSWRKMLPVFPDLLENASKKCKLRRKRKRERHQFQNKNV